MLVEFNDDTTKVKLLNKTSTFSFNNTGLDMQRLDQKINYNYLTQFKFRLSLYPIILCIAVPPVR